MEIVAPLRGRRSDHHRTGTSACLQVVPVRHQHHPAKHSPARRCGGQRLCERLPSYATLIHRRFLSAPLSYAVAPLVIDRTARRLDLAVTAPAMLRPGDELVLGYTAPTPSRWVLFAVDEGILQVAKYETPDPLDIFLRKKALQVATHQMVDLILPDYHVIRRSAAPGGGAAARLLGANLNPFRRRSEPPVAFWTDVVDAGPEPREVRFEIPDYFNGELRVMAVGVAEGKLGAHQTAVTVRSPIVPDADPADGGRAERCLRRFNRGRQ